MRRRIMLLVVGVTAFVLACAVIPLAFLARSTVSDRAQQDALNRANEVTRFLRTSQPTSAQMATYLASLDGSLSVSVRYADGTVVGTVPPAGESEPLPQLFSRARDFLSPRPSTAPGEPLSSDPAPQRPAQLRQVNTGVIATAFISGALVEVYLPNSDRYSGVYAWWWLMAAVGLGLLLIGAGAAELLTRRLVRPLTVTAQTAHALGSGDFTARAPTDGPREIAEVGKALNSLADRIDTLIDAERQTVADLSHRLRTPLTALRLDAEALKDPEESARVGEDVTALERSLTALIRAARRPEREGQMPSADLRAVVADRFAFWSALADDQQRHYELHLPDTAGPVRASGEDLAAAVDALLENVIAHTEEGTAFTVAVCLTDDTVTLRVSDEGAGLPPDAGERGRSDRGSTGLGLDIARRTAEAGGGSMQIGCSPSGGAFVELRFGLAPPG